MRQITPFSRSPQSLRVFDGWYIAPMLGNPPSSALCSSGLKRIALTLPLIYMLAGCAVQVSAPPKTVQATAMLPTVYTDSSRLNAPSNETPIAVNFKTTTQLKLQAAQHWARIADDTARSIGESLRKVGKCGQTFEPCKAVYVNPPVNITEFSRAFYNQVITALVKADFAVARTPESDLTLDIDIQRILFSLNRPQYRYAGVATELGPGVWALRDVAYVNPNNGDVIPPSEDALHWFRSEFASGQTPQYEILVTVSVGSKNRYLGRATNAYYVADADRHLYDEEVCSLNRLCEAGSRTGKAVEVKTTRQLQVVSDCPLDKCIDDGTTVDAGIKPKEKRK